MKVFSSVLVVAGLAVDVISQSLPTVDLGYETHQALAYNVSRIQSSTILSDSCDRMPTTPTASTISDLHKPLLETCVLQHQSHLLVEIRWSRMVVSVQFAHKLLQAGSPLLLPSPQLLLQAISPASTTLRL